MARDDGTRRHPRTRSGAVWRAAGVALTLAVSSDSAERVDRAQPKSAPPTVAAGSATRALPVPSAERNRGTASLRLLDAGAAPRRRLRYRLDRCKSTKVELSTEGRTILDLAGRTQTLVHPRGRTLLSVEPRGRATETELGLAWTVAESTAAGPQSPGAFLGQVPPAGVGVRAEGWVSDRGMVQRTNFGSPGHMATPAPGAARAPEFLVALPYEEVGPGAEWELEGPRELLGVPGSVRAVYRVVRVASSQVTLSITLQSHAPPQAVPARYLQPGSHMDVLSLSGSGSGQAIVNLDRVASEITETVRTDLRARMTVGTRQEEANSNVLVTTRIHVVER